MYGGVEGDVVGTKNCSYVDEMIHISVFCKPVTIIGLKVLGINVGL